MLIAAAMSLCATGLFAQDITETDNQLDPNPGKTVSVEFYDETPEEYNKTFSIGVNPGAFILLGPSVGVEFTGQSPFGVYAFFQYIGPGLLINYLGNQINADISGWGVNSGGKYYYQYDANFHDSNYLSVEYVYASMKAEETLGTASIDLTSHTAMIYHGWRWQWSLFYLDCNFGIGYSFGSVATTGNFSEDDKNTLKNGVTGFAWGGSIVVGVAF
ncbi:MAG: hypothetical protein GY754_29815, partial [bacterium]|nr:hypothetical protein [bacterium]